ncbi:MAG: hypothetical protein QM682_03520 [Paracoccus sp. (in: a-proteobacteria)]|uniref:hypothetical protein n=1 Tax=Paracoccus sp. TaxID=267 RepID=UPI0039E5FB1B
MAEASDPFAAARDKVLETVKWLASTLGAVTGALATGIALTALPKLSGAAMERGIVLGVLGLACLGGCIGLLLWIMLNPPVRLREVLADAGLRDRLIELVPRGYPENEAGLDLFLDQHRKAVARLADANRAYEATAAGSPERADALGKQNSAAKALAPFEGQIARLTSYGHLLVLRQRVYRAVPALLLLSVIGLGCLSRIGLDIGRADSPKPPAGHSLTIEWR